MGKKNHLQWIDLLRGFAICCVVLVHALEQIYSAGITSVYEMPEYIRNVIFTLFTVGRLGVPIFVLITGFLLLDRTFSAEGCKRFWKNNLLGLLVTTEIWIIIYNIFLVCFSKSRIDIVDLIKNMIFVTSLSEMGHIWYLYMILGIYIFIPFVAMFLKVVDLKLLKFPMIILFIYMFVLPVINVIFQSYGKATIWNCLTLEFGGGLYGFIMILGYLVKKGSFSKIKSRTIFSVMIISMILSVWLQIFSAEHNYKYTVRYECAFLLITAFCIFLLISRRETIPFQRVFGSLARCSFGIYLVHFPLLMVLNRHIHMASASKKLVVLCLLGLFISWIFVMFVGRIPKAAKWLFYMKDRTKSIT